MNTARRGSLAILLALAILGRCSLLRADDEKKSVPGPAGLAYRSIAGRETRVRTEMSSRTVTRVSAGGKRGILDTDIRDVTDYTVLGRGPDGEGRQVFAVGLARTHVKVTQNGKTIERETTPEGITENGVLYRAADHPGVKKHVQDFLGPLMTLSLTPDGRELDHEQHGKTPGVQLLTGLGIGSPAFPEDRTPSAGDTWKASRSYPLSFSSDRGTEMEIEYTLVSLTSDAALITAKGTLEIDEPFPATSAQGKAITVESVQAELESTMRFDTVAGELVGGTASLKVKLVMQEVGDGAGRSLHTDGDTRLSVTRRRKAP